MTGVGGTQLHLDASGNESQPDTVWNDTDLFSSPAAQRRRSVQSSSRARRTRTASRARSATARFPGHLDERGRERRRAGLPEREAAQGPAGFYLIGGTSEASPEFAGIIAIADQVAGHGLGLINPALYRWKRPTTPASSMSRRATTP